MGRGNYIGGGSVLKVFYRPSQNKTIKLAFTAIEQLNSELVAKVLSDTDYIRSCEKLLLQFDSEERRKLSNRMLLQMPSVKLDMRKMFPVRKVKGKNRINAGKKFHKSGGAK